MSELESKTKMEGYEVKESKISGLKELWITCTCCQKKRKIEIFEDRINEIPKGQPLCPQCADFLRKYRKDVIELEKQKLQQFLMWLKEWSSDGIVVAKFEELLNEGEAKP